MSRPQEKPLDEENELYPESLFDEYLKTKDSKRLAALMRGAFKGDPKDFESRDMIDILAASTIGLSQEERIVTIASALKDLIENTEGRDMREFLLAELRKKDLSLDKILSKIKPPVNPDAAPRLRQIETVREDRCTIA